METTICDINLASEIICDVRTTVAGPNEFIRFGRKYYVSDELKEIVTNKLWYELNKYLEEIKLDLEKLHDCK